MLPNFLIIGADKSGTTSIYSYLDQHPEIFMSPIKEPNFFFVENKYEEWQYPLYSKELSKNFIWTLEDYLKLFDGVKKEKAFGEASPTYLNSADAAKNIKRHIPNAKLIAILRNNADRIFSTYTMFVRLGHEKRAFEDALHDEIEKKATSRLYINHGYYFDRVNLYFNEFNRDQLRIYLYEDLKNRQMWLLEDMFKFIGVDHTFEPDISKAHNVTPKMAVNSKMSTLLEGQNTIISNLKSYLPSKLKKVLKTYIYKKFYKKPQLSEDTRKKLVEIYREDIINLQTLIRRDLSPWLKI